MTVVFAALLHAGIILGVTFNFEDAAKPETLPTLDIILVQRQSETPPDDADYLAQASQQGGGLQDTPARPQAPISGQIPKPEPGIAPMQSEAAAPQPQPDTPTPTLTMEQSNSEVQQQPDQDETPPTPRPTARELMERSLEIARLEAEIGRRAEAYAKRPKRKWISANTREYEYASYMQAWVAKVERVGNLNYPSEARRQRLYGSLVLTVAIRRDGSIDEIKIIDPSGHRVLDEAAIDIVRLASPYSPFPDDIQQEVDILHITRTWQFLPGNVLRHD